MNVIVACESPYRPTSVFATSVAWLAMLLLAGAGTGCKSYPPALTVQLDSKSRAQNVQVHLLAVNQSTYEKYMAMRMDDYWRPGRTDDSSALLPIALSSGTGTRVVARSDPIWNVWGDGTRQYLMIFADTVPGQNRNTRDDPRRGWMPLNKEAYDFASKITISVGSGGVQVDPQPSPRRKYLSVFD